MNLDVLWETTLLDPRYKQYGFRGMDLDESIFKSTRDRIISELSSISANIPAPVEPTRIEIKKVNSTIWEEFYEVVQDVLQLVNPISASIEESRKIFKTAHSSHCR